MQTSFRILTSVAFWLFLQVPLVLAAEEPKDAAAAAIEQNMAAQSGIVKGSLNPAKRGIKLPAKPKVMIIPVNDEETTKYGMIDDWQANFIERRLRRAAEEKFDLVILEIDTYGGKVSACERINRAIAACPVPVVAFVKAKAFSGGAIISLGSKMIVMAPGSRIGGAKAVSLFGEIPESMRQKVDSDMRAMVSNLCDANNYPAPIAVGMVNSEAEVIETNDPQKRFMLGETYDVQSVKPEKVKVWKNKGQILTLTANEAVNVGLASGIVADTDELQVGLGISPSSVEVAAITPAERSARFVSHPIWSVLLVLIGLVALVWELKSPGHGMGYIAFAFCLGVFFWLQVFSANAGLFEIALFGIGAAIIAVELFVFPTFGAGLAAGIIMVVGSLILAFVPESVSLINVIQGKGSAGDIALLKEGLMWATLTVVILIGAVVTGLIQGARMPGLSRLALRAEVNSTTTAFGTDLVAAGAVAAVAIPEPSRQSLVGQQAVAETVLRPAGKIRIGGLTHDAVSEGPYIDAGTPVVVLRVNAGTLVVRQA
ncbi:MAG TPA: NfeD family protein [Planctomycetota bacterium]|nr:NfeD family protein [Planctomycetota bacterium]